MNLANFHLFPLRALPAPMTFMIAFLLALLQGCVANAPSCDGRFEPINLPAPAVSASAEDGTATESDTDHERR